MSLPRKPTIFVLAVLSSAPFFKHAVSFSLPPLHGTPEATPPSTVTAGAFMQEKELMQANAVEQSSSKLPSIGPLLAGGLLGLLIAVGSVAPSVAADGKGKAWGYRETDKWKADYPLCGEKEQSPVDLFAPGISTNNPSNTLSSFVKYVPLADRVIYNNQGKTAQINGSFGSMTLPDGEYDVKQVHFHFPSEHTVGGKDTGDDVVEGHRTAGEVHIVHQRKGATGTDGIATVGIMLEEGSENASADQALLKQIGFGIELPGERMKLGIPGVMDLNSFQDQLNGPFWHYKGSLTTPPCTENVHWYVADKPAVVTKDMIMSFKARFPPDYRKPQPIGLRELDIGSICVPGEFPGQSC